MCRTKQYVIGTRRVLPNPLSKRVEGSVCVCTYCGRGSVDVKVDTQNSGLDEDAGQGGRHGRSGRVGGHTDRV